nr:dihydroneopterin aldolase [uncultured Solibaculum sp.]
MDRIRITGLRVFAYHGVLDREQEEGQPFVLDLILGVNLKRPGYTDRVEDTINYAEACQAVQEAMTGCKYRLIERAAQEVASRLLKQYESLEEITVILKKPRAPIPADFDTVAVEITRRREDMGHV